MSRHNDHSHQKNSQREHQASHSSKKSIHRDWRFWLAVVLMLGAMGIYVATMDESLGPGGQVEQEVPADAE